MKHIFLLFRFIVFLDLFFLSICTKANTSVFSSKNIPAVHNNTAKALEITYSIHSIAGANGIITPEGEINVVAGTDFSFDILANSNYLIDSLIVNGTYIALAHDLSQYNYLFLNVNEDNTISVTFYQPGCATPILLSAGRDTAICSYSGGLFQLNASINDPSIGTIWEVVDDNYVNDYFGSSDPSLLNAEIQIYPIDIQNGYIKVKITSYDPNGPCVEASDIMVIRFDNGPLHGTYTINSDLPSSCTNYQTFYSAINDLNNRSISSNVIFEVAANHQETVCNEGFALGNPKLDSATNPNLNNYRIKFIKTGAGNNPLLRAWPGQNTSSSAYPDGIWSLRGVDNVTIDGIDLIDTNTVSNIAMMEYGFGLFKANPNDGAQNDTIRNCTITLNRNNVEPGAASFFDGSVGIVVVNDTATNVNDNPITPASSSGTNSYNKFYANTIQNCNTGIALIGYPAKTRFNVVDYRADIHNVIGDDKRLFNSIGNKIINFGGGVNASVPSYGIYLKNQFYPLVQYNAINNHFDNSAVNHTYSQYGIESIGQTSNYIDYNNINITGGANSHYYGIDNQQLDTTSYGVFIYGNNLSVSIPASIATTAGTGSVNCIVNNTNEAASVNINSNTIKKSAINGSGDWVGILNYTNTNSSGKINLINNVIDSNQILSVGNFTGIQNNATAFGGLDFIGNKVTNNSKMISDGNELNWICYKTANNVSGNLVVKNNVIENDTALISSTNASDVFVNAMRMSGANSSSTVSLKGNLVRKISVQNINAGNNATLRGCYATLPSGETPNEIIDSNKISGLFISASSGASGSHYIYGIESDGQESNTKDIFNNTLDTFYVRDNGDATPLYNATIMALCNAGGGSTVNIYRNKIAHLIPFGSSNVFACAKGISLLSASNNAIINISNNMINMDLAAAYDGASSRLLSSGDAIKGVEMVESLPCTNNLYFNTIRLSGTGAVGFGSSAVSVTSSTPGVAFSLKNNILVNKCKPQSGGMVTALRKSSDNTTYDINSSNNLFYADSSSGSSYLFINNGITYNTLIAPWNADKETNSICTYDPSFVKAIDFTDSLHLNTHTNCLLNGTGVSLGAAFENDIDGQSRQNPPDIGADEFDTDGGGFGQWSGVNNNWNDPVNWCGTIPSSATDVTIPSGKTYYPLLTTSINDSSVCRNLAVNSGGELTIAAYGKLKVFGTLFNTGSIEAKDGTIELSGAAPQAIPSHFFNGNLLRNLIINNAAVSLADTLNLLGKISFPGNNSVFNTNNFLTLKSSDTLTASVADLTNNNTSTGNDIVGQVTVERYISNKKAWRLLSMPTKHLAQTINQSWMEGGAVNNNPVNSYGIQITSNRPSWLADGFDTLSNGGPSVKTFNPTTNSWDGIANTNQHFINGEAYMAFIRGDRSVTSYLQAPTATILREKDGLHTGDFLLNNLGTAGGQFVGVGNPYASAISLSNLNATNLDNAYYFWDPALGGANGYGAYQSVTVDANGDVSIAPGGGSYTSGNYNVQSGQGFIVHTNSGVGALAFKESNKVNGSNLCSRPPSHTRSLRVNIYSIQNNNTSLIDGVLHLFDSSFAEHIDKNDIVKFGNVAENIAIKKNDTLLAIERSTLPDNSDTLFYNLAQMKAAHYRFCLTPDFLNDSGLEAYLEDTYLHAQTPISLSDTTTVDFSIVNLPGSYNAERFRLIFKTMRVVPLNFIKISALSLDDNVVVKWEVNNEIDTRAYIIERAADGIHFDAIGTMPMDGTSTYRWLDDEPLMGDNFYRIKRIDFSGANKYSSVVKVKLQDHSSITISPNPIEEDRMVNIKMTNVVAGVYQIKITNAIGQLVHSSIVNHKGNHATIYPIKLKANCTKGHYHVEIYCPKDTKIVVGFVL